MWFCIISTFLNFVNMIILNFRTEAHFKQVRTGAMKGLESCATLHEKIHD